MKAPRLASGALGQPGQWNALHDDAAGSGTLLAHQQLGYYTLGTNPTNGQNLSFVVNGTTITLTGRTGAISAAGDFAIQSSAPLTLAVILNQLQNPWTTNATQIALSLPNQQLLAYVGFALSGTKITAYSLNTVLQAPLTSYSGSTTFSSGSWTGQTMQLYVEPGTYYIGSAQVKFTGGSSPTITAPVSHPRIDVLTIDSSGTLAWTTGTENASPTVPAYPLGKVPVCELYNVVGETALYDNANQQTGQGYIQADVRPFNSFLAGIYPPTSNGTGSANAAGTQPIAHGLGKVPQLLRIFATQTDGSTQATIPLQLCTGTYNGSTVAACNFGTGSPGSVIVFVTNSAVTHTASATVTWDATNFYLSWTNGGSIPIEYTWDIQ